MKKYLKNMLACVLASCVVFSAAGCGGGENKIDDTKSQLYVYNYNGGVGSVWLDKVIKDFSEDFKNYSFEPGKKGVQIIAEKAKTAELQTIANSANEVIFAEIANYPNLVDTKVLLDITDILDVNLNAYLVDESGNSVTSDATTIKSKMYEESVDFYSYKEGKFYALPHYAIFSCVTYNKALFDEKKLYFAKNPGSTKESQFIQSGNTEKSCGPDGVDGTDDDGLPATWDEMFLLCDYMKERDVTPFLWCGGTDIRAGYYNYLLNAVYLNLAGAEQARYNYSFDSGSNEITIIENFDASGNPVTKKEVVNSSNYGKVLNSELEKYQTIAIVDKILDNTDWQASNCNNGASTMLSTQNSFIFSANEDDKPIAMFVEGSYWYNESVDAGYINDAEQIYGEEFSDKNDFRIMSLPRVYSGRAKDLEGKTIHKTVSSDQNDTIACINAKIASNPDKVKLAKMFLAYCYTDEKLAEFTETTRVTRSLKYDVDTSKLDSWGTTVWNYTRQSDLVLPYSSNSAFLNNRSRLSMHINNSFWNSTAAKKAYNNLKGADKTALDYFNEYMNRTWS